MRKLISLCGLLLACGGDLHAESPDSGTGTLGGKLIECDTPIEKNGVTYYWAVFHGEVAIRNPLPLGCVHYGENAPEANYPVPGEGYCLPAIPVIKSGEAWFGCNHRDERIEVILP